VTESKEITGSLITLGMDGQERINAAKTIIADAIITYLLFMFSPNIMKGF
jgi:hypothetical protein